MLNVSVVPSATNAVEYFESIERQVLIANTSSKTVLIEEVALRFQSDRGQASQIVSRVGTWELNGGGSVDVIVPITPTPSFLAHTNMFDIRVRFRVKAAGRFAGSRSEVTTGSTYLIINPSRTSLGPIFISIKQPEDERLGRILETMARRAGFEPFLKANNPRPGQDMWADVIEPNLKRAKGVFVIWTDKTEWGSGVLKEVEFCRTNCIQDILLLQDDYPVPEIYEGSPLEYQRFDIENPAPAFEKTLVALRNQLIIP